MQYTDNDEQPLEENQEELENPAANLVGLVSHLASRRGAMGAVLAALAGTAPFLMARPAQAAPADLKGSPNIAVKIYENKAGKFTLCSDGRIWDLDTGAEACSGLSQYSVVAGGKFKTLKPNQGRIKGSPNIAVDAFVDKTGTYVLFADGSVRQPNGAAGKEGGTGNVRIEYHIPNTGGAKTSTDGWKATGVGGGITWEPAFTVAPVVFRLDASATNSMPDSVPRLVIASTTEAAVGTLGQLGGQGGGFIAIGIG